VDDFTATGNTWDAPSHTLRLGYELVPIVPMHDPAVEAWLGALFGTGLGEAYEWIAACRQDRLSELAVCLAIVGSPGCGKTVFFRGLAHLWGCDFVELGHVVDRFNSVVCRCPFWIDDECKTLRGGDLTSEEFRQLIQTSIHDYEPKGLERRTLRGYARFGLTANEPADLRFGAVYGAAAVQAVADRLAIYRVPDDSAARGALDVLRLPGTDRVDLGRMAGHFAWVMGAVTPRVTRFLGSRADNGQAVEAALQSVVGGYPELFEYLADFLAEPSATRMAFRFDAAATRLWVSPKRISGALEAGNARGKHDLGRVQVALKPFRIGGPVAERVGSEVVKMWELDVEMLSKALPD
jgi:hypothetical protein